MKETQRNDPWLSFRYQVEIKGLIVAGFSAVSGLEAEIETEDYREGGINDYVHKLPKGTKYPNITLKRGMTDSGVLWKWHRDAVNGDIQYKSGAIILIDSQGSERWRWEFEDAYPIKWTGPDFKADSSAVALETLELAHKGIKKG
jgi:phage tail-like protein